MKRFIITLIASAMVFSAAGCGAKPNSSAQVSSAETAEGAHEVVLDNLGLTYTTPSAWAEFEKTNIYPLTIQSDGTLARIIYNYIKADDVEKLSDLNDSASLSEYLTPICEIMVAPSENFTNGKLDNLTSLYGKKEDVSEENGYTYSVLSEYTSNKLSGDDLKNFNILSSAVPELIKSISTREFNPEDIKPVIDGTEDIKDYITFDTKTLEGEEISSTVFGDYDLTLVNFWGTYAKDTSNEQAVLEQVYEKASEYKDKKLNVINAIVDTPSEENEKIIKELKEQAGGKFTTIVMDQTLANWAVENLKGVPTTVFVNSDGKIVGDKLEGAKSADTYFDELIKRVGE